MARHTRSVHLPEALYLRIRAQAERLQRPIAWVLRRAWEVAEEGIKARTAPPTTQGANEDEAIEPFYDPRK